LLLRGGGGGCGGADFNEDEIYESVGFCKVIYSLRLKGQREEGVYEQYLGSGNVSVRLDGVRKWGENLHKITMKNGII
jgi:hypothetical protein